MSAQQCFAHCIDCWEMHYGISDSNGVYSRDSGSSNHWDHAVHVFGSPGDYVPPIRSVLTDLAMGMPISDGRMEMFSLALAVTAIEPNNGRKVAGADIPLGALEMEAEKVKRSVARASRERAPEPVGNPDMFDLEGLTV